MNRAEYRNFVEQYNELAKRARSIIEYILEERGIKARGEISVASISFGEDVFGVSYLMTGLEGSTEVDCLSLPAQLLYANESRWKRQYEEYTEQELAKERLWN